MQPARRIKYYFLRFTRLKGEPRDLALGMSLGIFSGMLPIMPFHMALAVALALFFRGSKITALIGTWFSNPFTWYILYYMNYRIGAFILGFPVKDRAVSLIMKPVEHGEEMMSMLLKFTGAGSRIVGAFALGGIIMGTVAAVPSYFIFLKLFQAIKKWHEQNLERRRLKRDNQ